MHNSTHSSQMNTVGPAMSLRTSCWLLPQKEQYNVLLLSPLAALVMVALTLRRRPREQTGSVIRQSTGAAKTKALPQASRS